MPTYLQDSVGISGGTTLYGDINPSGTLALISTSDSTKGSIIIAPSIGETIVSGRTSTLAINSSAAMFSGVTPKMEIVTAPPSDHNTYEQLVVIRHDGVGSDAVLRRLGILLKLNVEAASGGVPPDYESNKMGGMIVESSEQWANIPTLSLVTANVKRLTIHANGRIGINTVTDAGYQLDVNGTTRTSGLLSANAGLALTVGSDATGDMYYRNSSGNFARVGIGSSGQVLTVTSGLPVWGTGGGGSGLTGLTTGTPTNNTFLGVGAGFSNTSGAANVFIGKNAGYSNTIGGLNVMVGSGSGFSLSTGSENVCLGDEAGPNITIGNNNVCLGATAGGYIITENGNTILGSLAGITTGTNFSTAIGLGAVVAQSYSMALGGPAGSGNEVKVGIGTSTPSCELEVVGTIKATGLSLNIGSGATGDIYYRDSTGNLHKLSIGSSGQTLKVVSGLPAWV